LAGAVHVEGLRELDLAFGRIAKDVRREMRIELKAAAEPVRTRAETFAVAEIHNIGERWSRMRVGVTPGLVYVAPKARNRGGSPRPNLGPLLLHAMEDALDASEPEVLVGFEVMIDRLTSEF